MDMDRREHHSIDGLKERGAEKGNVQHSTLFVGEQSVSNQTNICTVLRAALGRLWRDEAEHIWTWTGQTITALIT